MTVQKLFRREIPLFRVVFILIHMKCLLGIVDKETSRNTGGTPLMDWIPNRGWGGRAEVSCHQ